MRIASLFLVAMTLALSIGCADGQLPSESELDRLRILAARATPAEVAPGETVQLESLTFSPETGVVGVVWELCMTLECPTPEGREDPVAALDEGRIDPAAGLVGLEPDSPPAFEVPAELLDALPEPAREEGTFLRFGLSAVAWPEGDPDEVEWGTKDLPDSTSSQPNNNPALSTVWVGQTELAPGDTLAMEPGEYELDVVDRDAMAETYIYRTTDGELQTRQEDLDVRWYSDLGTIDGTVWDPGPIGQTGSLIVVVRDGRGGVDWSAFDVAVQ